MMQFHRSRLWFTVFGLILFVTACEEEARDDQVGSLVGSWQLTALSVDWVRDVASPEGTDPDTVYTLSASWDEAESIFGSEAHKADQILAAFTVGDTILDTTAAFTAIVLEYMQIAMTATFNEDFTYILAGTYPALRLVPDSCLTELVIPQIYDTGNYEVNYLTGKFGISPGAFDMLLPPFDDGQVALSNDSQTLTISYTDRDAHDQLIAEIGRSWNESEDRVIHGAGELPVDIVTGVFSETGLLGRTGYIMDTGGSLEKWGGYLTFYALTTRGYADMLIATDVVNTYEEALTYIGQLALTGQTEPTTGIPYATLLTDDSGRDFDPADIQAGGKLTYVINPVCVPVNEIIYFETTWNRIE